jgi:hypothetical protein
MFPVCGRTQTEGFSPSWVVNTMRVRVEWLTASPYGVCHTVDSRLTLYQLDPRDRRVRSGRLYLLAREFRFKTIEQRGDM